MSDKAKRLEELEAARKAREAKRGAASQARAIDEQIADLERLERLEAAIDSAGGEAGRTLLVVHAAYPDGKIAESILVRTPSPVIWKRYRSSLEASAKGAKMDSSVESDRLWRGCLVHPSEDAVSALVDRFPGLPDLLAEAITKLAGYRAEEVSGKS